MGPTYTSALSPHCAFEEAVQKHEKGLGHRWGVMSPDSAAHPTSLQGLPPTLCFFFCFFFSCASINRGVPYIIAAAARHGHITVQYMRYIQ